MYSYFLIFETHTHELYEASLVFGDVTHAFFKNLSNFEERTEHNMYVLRCISNGMPNR